MWTYHQSTGILTDSTGKIYWTGYSGAGAGRNNPAMQDQHNVGPIPRGIYNITGPECTHNVPCKDCLGIQTHHHGPFVLRLHPREEACMCGRSGFLVHGDNQTHTASEGCIIMPRPIRELMSPPNSDSVEVV